VWVREIDRDLVDRVVLFWEGSSLTGAPVLRRALTAAEHDLLTAHRDHLRAAIAPPQPSDQEPLTAVIARMLNAFPAVNRQSEAAAAGGGAQAAVKTAAGYLWTLRDCPPWAIVRACDCVRAGTAGIDRNFCPSEPALRAVADRLVEPYRVALARIERLIAAKVDAPRPAAPPASETVAAILMRHRDPERRAAAEREQWACDKARGALDRMAAEAAAANAGHARRAMADLAQRRAAAAVERVDAHGC
jgi:hypothetical protein